MIRIEIDDREVRRALEELRRRASNMTQAMHAIGQGLAEGSRERILDGRDWTGQPFAPNSPATLARKKGEKPLIDSKSFVRSRLHYQADADSVEVGSSAVQAAVLQFGARRGQFGSTRRGGKIPWGDIPARRYLPVTEDGRLDDAARDLVLDIIRAHLADAV
jgi:phage gpG-like protein